MQNNLLRCFLLRISWGKFARLILRTLTQFPLTCIMLFRAAQMNLALYNNTRCCLSPAVHISVVALTSLALIMGSFLSGWNNVKASPKESSWDWDAAVWRPRAMFFIKGCLGFLHRKKGSWRNMVKMSTRRCFGNTLYLVLRS